jgi:hypothetical protein
LRLHSATQWALRADGSWTSIWDIRIADAERLYGVDYGRNNIGNRAVGMPKVKQKISGCFRTLDGAKNFCVVRSCLDTLHKQGYRMLDVLRRAFADDPRPAT